jgi:hypothetical protein
MQPAKDQLRVIYNSYTTKQLKIVLILRCTKA